jgi:predicted permease
MIAAANIAGMLLARAAHRRREIAIRLALGASRGRLVRQLVTESLVLCLVGGVAGVILARWLVSLLPVVQPPIGVRVSLDLEIDRLVLAVSFGVALVAGLVAGVTPALQSTRFDLLSGLRGLGAGDVRGRSRRAFVIGQLAMSLVLLVVAGLFTRAAQRALRTDPGLDPRGVAVGLVDVGSHGYDRDLGESFYRRLVERLGARPEITAVALGQWTPLSLGHMGDGIALPDGSRIAVTYGVADRGYLEAMRIPVVAGRSFDARDTRASAPTVIINETLARRLWPGRSPIGQAIKFAGTVREVIGVVRDGKYRSLDEPPTTYAFIPFAQRYSGQMTVHVRARGDAAAALAALRAEVRGLDPNIAVDRARPLADDIALYSLIQRMAAWVVGIFGLVGMVLAALGTYAVIAYRVAQRTREIGIRMALGARSSDVVLRVLREGLAMIAIGLAIGVPVALIAARAVRSFLFGLDTADAVTFAAVPAMLGVVGAVASYLPARRAAAVDPMISLRTD